MNSTTPNARTDSAPATTWDPVVRIGHWLLAAAFVTAWIAGDDYQQVHVLAGYTIAVILLVRVAWGVFGPRNARFTDFVRGPRAVFRYLRGLLRGEPESHRGHNPAGGWMVVLLLAALTLQVGSGMTIYALEEGKGPLAGWWAAERVPVEPAAAAREPRRYDDDHEGREAHGHDDGGSALEEAAEELHEFGSDFLLVLIALHIAGVLVSSLAHRENFVRAMITGRRSSDRATIDP